MLLVGWPHGMKTNNKSVSVFWHTMGATIDYYNEQFLHPNISEEEMKSGCRLDLDTWADNISSGKHVYVEEFIKGKTVTATGFSVSLGSMKDLSVANVLYDFDKEYVTTFF